MAKISRNIKRLRIEKKLTQDALAEKICVTRQAVSSWENDRTQPDIDMLESLSSALEVNIEELIYGEKRNIGLEAEKTKYRSTLSVIFAILGSLLVAVGLIMVFVTGWDNFPIALKTVFAFVPMLVGQFFTLFTVIKKKNSVPFREGAAVLWCAGMIATVAMINSIYELSFGYEVCLLIDGAMCLPVMYILGASVPLAFCSYSVIHWGIWLIHPAGDETVSCFIRLIPIALLAAVLLFIPIAKKTLDEMRLGYCVWIAVIACVVLITLIAAFSNMNFLLMLLLCGILLFAAEEKGEYFNVFSLFGFLLTVVPTVLLSFGINFANFYEIAETADIIFIACLAGAILLAAAFVVVRKRTLKNNAVKLSILACALVSTAVFLSCDLWKMSKGGNPAIEGYILFIPMLSAFAMGVCLLIFGAKKMSFLNINVGFAVIAAEIYALLIKGELELWQNGLILIVLGSALLIMNYSMAKKKKKLDLKENTVDDKNGGGENA